MSYIPAGSGTQWGGSVTSINIQRYSDAEEVVAEHTDGAIDEGNQPAAPTEKRARSAAGRVGIFVLLLFVASLAWHVASDLFAPSTSSGAVAASTTQIAPRAAGQVAAIYVTDNQEVEQGQPLFALDPAPFELAVRQAESAYQQALVGLDASTINLTASRAQVEQAQASLESNRATLERTRSLYDRGSATQAQLEAAELQLASSQSTLDSARASLESARLQVGQEGQPNPQVETARIQLEQAELNLAFATVVAPADGVITNLQLSVGQFVNAGAPAMTFIDSQQPWLVVDLRENQLANVEVGDPVSLIFDAVPGRTFKGQVRGIAWGIDPGRMAANGLPQNQPATRWFEPARTIPVQIELVQDEPWPRNVRAGSKAAALIFATDPNNPVALVSRGLQVVQSYLSYLY